MFEMTSHCTRTTEDWGGGRNDRKDGSSGVS